MQLARAGRPQCLVRRRLRSDRWAQLTHMAVPLSVVAVVVVLVIPLPTFLIDLLITANITGSVLVLLTAMQVKRPLDFSVFPTLVLVATMFRLALNVAVTRQVLLHGYAGVVVSSFGHFVIGGSIVVGLVVFLILIIIQFVVITSGSGRVAEVAARFTLDGMPGKQMAIDADRASGVIDEHEARRRRKEIADEADFYGAMDGASKFVRGDAIAAIVITLVNLIGGLAIGIFERHLSASQAIGTVQPLVGGRRVGLPDPGPPLVVVHRHHRDPGGHRARPGSRRGHPALALPAHRPHDRTDHGAPRHRSRACRSSPSSSSVDSSSSSGPGFPRTPSTRRPRANRPRSAPRPRSRPRRWRRAWRWSR